MVVKSKKPVAPAFLGYLCAGAYAGVVVLLIFSYVLKKPYLICCASGIVAVLFILSKSLSWYKQATLSKYNKCLLFEVQDIVGVLGRDITKYHIYSVDSIKKHGSYYKLIGNIEMFEPMRKGKTIGSMKIPDLTPEMLEMLESYKG